MDTLVWGSRDVGKIAQNGQVHVVPLENLYKISKEIKGFRNFPYNFKTHVAKNDENYVEGSKEGGNLK